MFGISLKRWTNIQLETREDFSVDTIQGESTVSTQKRNHGFMERTPENMLRHEIQDLKY